MTVQQYASLAHPDEGPASVHFIQMSVADSGSAPTEFPKTRIRDGKPIHFSNGRDFVYPASYRPALPSKDRKAVEPATPQEFQTVKTGFQSDLRSKREGSVEIIEGTISVTDFQGFSQMGGAYGQAILDGEGRLITENRIEMPKFATYTTPVWVAIKPGGSATFRISHPRKDSTVTLRVTAGN
jgi:hypothetical protein